MPVRREYIPKKNGKKRPLGLPTWSDKLLDLLAASFFPVIRDFYKSDRGRKFWEEYLEKNGKKVDTAAV